MCVITPYTIGFCYKTEADKGDIIDVFDECLCCVEKLFVFFFWYDGDMFENKSKKKGKFLMSEFCFFAYKVFIFREFLECMIWGDELKSRGDNDSPRKTFFDQ